MKRVSERDQLWATSGSFCPAFLFVYLWQVSRSLYMYEDNVQQLLLFFLYMYI